MKFYAFNEFVTEPFEPFEISESGEVSYRYMHRNSFRHAYVWKKLFRVKYCEHLSKTKAVCSVRKNTQNPMQNLKANWNELEDFHFISYLCTDSLLHQDRLSPYFFFVGRSAQFVDAFHFLIILAWAKCNFFSSLHSIGSLSSRFVVYSIAEETVVGFRTFIH